MFCRNCGAAVDGRFCSKCGSLVAAEDSAKAELVFSQTRQNTLTKPGAPTAGTAIAAIICTFFIPLLGLILGLVARSEIRNSKGEKAGDGLANAAVFLSAFFMVLYFFIGVAWLGLFNYSSY